MVREKAKKRARGDEGEKDWVEETAKARRLMGKRTRRGAARAARKNLREAVAAAWPARAAVAAIRPVRGAALALFAFARYLALSGSRREILARQAACARRQADQELVEAAKALADLRVAWHFEGEERLDGDPLAEDGAQNPSSLRTRAAMRALTLQKALKNGADPDAWIPADETWRCGGASGESVAPWRALAVALSAMEAFPREAGAAALALLEAGADLEADPFGEGCEPAFGVRLSREPLETWAARWASTPVLEAMDRAGADWERPGEGSPLCHAACEGNAQALAFFLDRKSASVDGQWVGCAALSVAAGASRRRDGGAGALECARLLLAAGADPEGAGGVAKPLELACSVGWLEMAKTLVEAGADCARADAEGSSIGEAARRALRLARTMGNEDAWGRPRSGAMSAEALLAEFEALPARIEANKIARSLAPRGADSAASDAGAAPLCVDDRDPLRL
jgi:hypothetical protein